MVRRSHWLVRPAEHLTYSSARGPTQRRASAAAARARPLAPNPPNLASSCAVPPSFIAFFKFVIKGYELYNTSAFNVTCLPTKDPSSASELARRYPWLIAIIVIVGILVSVLVLYILLVGHGTRPALVQYWLNVSKRVHGEPVGRAATVVVTGEHVRPGRARWSARAWPGCDGNCAPVWLDMWEAVLRGGPGQ